MDSELERILATGQEGSSILARGLGFLHLVAASSGASVKELSERAGLPLATTYRIVNQLRGAGFVVEYDGRIHAGAAMAPASTEGPHLVDYARPALIRAARPTGITAVLTVRVHTLALCLDVVPAGSSGAPVFRIGATRTLYAGASATPLLAFAAPAVVANVLGSGIKRYTAATPTAEALPAKLAEIRQRGYDLSHGEIQPQWTALGLPVFDRGSVFCCLSLTGPSAQFADVDLLLATLREAADHLTKHLPASSDGLPWNATDPTETGD
jgi:DNA-binding IclR family transcriptional regulator